MAPATNVPGNIVAMGDEVYDNFKIGMQVATCIRSAACVIPAVKATPATARTCLTAALARMATTVVSNALLITL